MAREMTPSRGCRSRCGRGFNEARAQWLGKSARSARRHRGPGASMRPERSGSGNFNAWSIHPPHTRSFNEARAQWLGKSSGDRLVPGAAGRASMRPERSGSGNSRAVRRSSTHRSASMRPERSGSGNEAAAKEYRRAAEASMRPERSGSGNAPRQQRRNRKMTASMRPERSGSGNRGASAPKEKQWNRLQ